MFFLFGKNLLMFEFFDVAMSEIKRKIKETYCLQHSSL